MFLTHIMRVKDRIIHVLEDKMTDEEGAVTAEYALVIMAAVALAGVLIAIVRSDEIRAVLVDLVQRALNSAG